MPNDYNIFIYKKNGLGTQINIYCCSVVQYSKQSVQRSPSTVTHPPAINARLRLTIFIGRSKQNFNYLDHILRSIITVRLLQSPAAPPVSVISHLSRSTRRGGSPKKPFCPNPRRQPLEIDQVSVSIWKTNSILLCAPFACRPSLPQLHRRLRPPTATQQYHSTVCEHVGGMWATATEAHDLEEYGNLMRCKSLLTVCANSNKLLSN